MNLDKIYLNSAISSTISCWTYCAPRSSPPLVVCWRHIPAAVPWVTSWILRIFVGLVINALAVVNRRTGCSSTLLFCHGPLIRITERLVHWLGVVGANHLSGGSSYTTSHWTLWEESQRVLNKGEIEELWFLMRKKKIYCMFCKALRTIWCFHKNVGFWIP